MTSRPLVYLGIFVLLLGIASAVGFVIKNKPAGEPVGPGPISNATTTPQEPAASGPIVPVASSTYAIPFPASTTMDTSSWPIYVDPERRFSVEHPKNLIQSYSNGVSTFIFPKNVYFTWPLLDDARVTISVEPKCPKPLDGASEIAETAEFDLNGQTVTRTIAQGAAAGNLYLEVSYDFIKSGFCYHVSFYNHGANGSGLFVDSASLIKRYDAEHEKAMQAIYKIVNAMVTSFKILAD